MITTLRKAKHFLKRQLQWNPAVTDCPNLVTLGTKYGGWVVPTHLLDKNSICYMAGAGEDISFDVSVVVRYNCEVHIFDPTPRAKAHYDKFVQNVKAGKLTANNDRDAIYNKLKPDHLRHLNFHEYGAWKNDEIIRFYAPKNPAHVSHSLVNLQKTEDYFEAQVYRLTTIMDKLTHTHIDLFKIDIEGAEYKVLSSMVRENIRPKVLCVEYDEAYLPQDSDYRERIKASVKELTDFGYKVVHSDAYYNVTFVDERFLK